MYKNHALWLIASIAIMQGSYGAENKILDKYLPAPLSLLAHQSWQSAVKQTARQYPLLPEFLASPQAHTAHDWQELADLFATYLQNFYHQSDLHELNLYKELKRSTYMCSGLTGLGALLCACMPAPQKGDYFPWRVIPAVATTVSIIGLLALLPQLYSLKKARTAHPRRYTKLEHNAPDHALACIQMLATLFITQCRQAFQDHVQPPLVGGRLPLYVQETALNVASQYGLR